MTWKQIPDVSDTDSPVPHKDMRYFIYYPPKKSIRLIDVSESVLVEDVLTVVKREFGLNIENNGPDETSVILSYNGSDLKPKWSLAELSIPSGSIIRCLYRQEKAADLYIHCGFNKQTLKIFDASITIDTTIGTIRKKISEKLGLPLSIFCLETHDRQLRLYDQMKLTHYELKIHDHLYLKVWRGYEKFINSCVKGFTEQYSYDDLTRHYQTQIALHIAAFYGHMELASSVMQQGARSDRPVGEHPSRQWSSASTTAILPELLKCPIHIAVERGHAKIVDLFVRQSALCTQVRDPITGYLPYAFALSRALCTKSKEERRRYRVIYIYLHDKQFHLQIPLNATGDYVLSLLSSTVSANAVHRSSTNLVYVSLAFYCKIIRWYERAREKTWKKYGGRCVNTSQTKRVYPKDGLLGYKVLIDGYNNTFDVPAEQLRNVRPASNSRLDQNSLCAGMSEEEREKIKEMKSYVKDFALDERTRAKRIAAANLQQSRRPPMLLSQTTTDPSKRGSRIATDMKALKSNLELDTSSINDLATSNLLSPPSKVKQSEDHDKHSRAPQASYHIMPSSRVGRPSIIIEDDRRTLPMIVSPASNTVTNYSSLTNRLEAVINANNNPFQSLMPSADAYALSAIRTASETEQRRAVKRRETFLQIQQSVEKQAQHQPEKPLHPFSTSLPLDHQAINIDVDIPLPDRPAIRRSSPIKSRLDLDIREATVKPYERYASATTRSTAVHCLQEASYFKGKSWLKQVEISKEMIKHQVKRRIRRIDDQTSHEPILLPLRTNITTTPSTEAHRPNAVKVN